MTTIGIIGYGTMGEAIYRMLAKQYGVDKLYVADTYGDCLQRLPAGHASLDVADIIDDIEVVILSVKPQSFQALSTVVGDRFKGKKILSIMAGVSIATLQAKTGVLEVLRAMPNLPLRVGKGITAWYPAPEVSDPAWAVEVLSAMGQQLRVQREELMDAVTAISGSGPAYFFYLCELLAAKAESFGFSSEEAAKLAESTFIGSAALLESDERSAADWRKAVTSQGGTTHAAIQYLAKHQFEAVFHQALDRAKERATELSQG